ncbi:MAG: zinc ribbon domain-containing protein [Rhodothermales bacterium]
MPTYVYRRADGSTFEVHQRITEDALTEDPETGQKVERVITGSAGLIFKGTGFYLTDYARKNGSGESKSSSESGDKSSSESGEKSSKSPSESKAPAARSDSSKE